MSRKSLETIGYYHILEKLKECAATENAGNRIMEMVPILSETELRKQQRDTTQARAMIAVSYTHLHITDQKGQEARQSRVPETYGAAGACFI